jgi:curved DNA-binding protein CbpA
MTPDPYGVLGVADDASDEELDRAFRVLVRRLHPDTRGAAGPDAEADRRLQELLTAYASLRDPLRRAAYDRTRSTPTTRNRTANPPTASARATGRPDIRVGPVRWVPARPGRTP